jgi:hypothetical protein
MARRRPAYRDADFTVPTDDLAVPEIADRIVALLSRPPGPVRKGARG